jgi:hypothetical protein
MDIDKDLLYRFEKGLDPQKIEGSTVPASIIGFGEISTIFQIGDNANLAFKRMPLFSNRMSAEKYRHQYNEYCNKLIEAGVKIPEHETIIIEPPKRPVVFYIAQKQLPADRFAHKLIHVFNPMKTRRLIEQIVSDISKIWQFNRSSMPSFELAIDGQLSNWVGMKKGTGIEILYIDTSTPLYRINGVEQLDPELLLQSAPSFLRWIIRLLFLRDVMNRYYDQRMVYIDLAANLYKEQRPDLILNAIDIINQHLSDNQKPLKMEEVEKYYREDKLIWSLFLTFRRIDRWLTTKLLRKRYEFILPGKIKR